MATDGHDEVVGANDSMISNNSPYQATTDPVPHRGTICGGLILDKLYLKSLPGILKMVEILLCIIILICLGAAQVCSGSCSGFGFLRGMAIGAMIFTLILLIVFALTLNKQLTFIHWSGTDLLNSAIDALLLIIASIVLATQSATAAETAAVVFGFFAAIIYCVSAWMAYRVCRVDYHKRKSNVGHTQGIPQA
ncbi:CKLF-like MARVEL transmembrane domain-containing protein 4 [Styela clava]|uniref:CKLF-like MARVEL transmembrane domain-containing protein 4 n=1 Tax=Styela clava TaxID=7725 RepID=UPI00193A5B50|nr:CKLF-like MARVEL transmembrane domain-containing protein 4 [Styela clava]